MSGVAGISEPPDTLINECCAMVNSRWRGSVQKMMPGVQSSTDIIPCFTRQGV
ncbi:hypothetical protein AB65_2478 [Escherichia coli 2-460-02_S1_C3]|nr:hypothetical protein AB65_2478 [Escherichia coli 2-460-02_S1_C3]